MWARGKKSSTATAPTLVDISTPCAGVKPGEPVIFEWNGRRLALLTAEEIAAYQVLEDADDAELAAIGEEAMIEFIESGEEAIPLEQVKRERGLD